MKKEQLADWTLEQAAEYALQQIIAQGTRCLNDVGRCVYGDKEGRHCAVGWLLDEDNPELMDYEGSLGCLVSMYREHMPAVILKNQPAFGLLQTFHDTDSRAARIKTAGLDSFPLPHDHPLVQRWIEMAD